MIDDMYCDAYSEGYWAKVGDENPYSFDDVYSRKAWNDGYIASLADSNEEYD